MPVLGSARSPRPALRSLAVLLAGAALAAPVPARPAAAETTAEEILACMRGNDPGDATRQAVSMVATDRVGHTTRLQAEIFWDSSSGRSNVLMHFGDPPDMRGAALLMKEQKGRNDMFMYLPELGRTKRITTHMMQGSMFGTDFSYEEFERLQGMSEDLSSERLPDETVADRPVWVLSQVPDEESGSAYERVVTWVDQETCVPLRVRFFESGDRARKEMRVDPAKISQQGEAWIPLAVTMQDLEEGTQTAISIDELEVDADIPRKVFSQAELERLGR